MVGEPQLALKVFELMPVDGRAADCTVFVPGEVCGVHRIQLSIPAGRQVHTRKVVRRLIWGDAETGALAGSGRSGPPLMRRTGLGDLPPRSDAANCQGRATRVMVLDDRRPKYRPCDRGDR